MKISDPKLINKIQQIYKAPEISKVGNKSGLPRQGELIEGEILDLKQSSVTIRLSNGQTVEAKMTDAFEFFIGQKLSFLVKDSTNEQLLLKPLSEQGETAMNKFIYILQNAGFSATKGNLQVVSKLIENNLPIDQETLQKIIPQTKQFNGVDIDKLLFLFKNNIPITKESIGQLDDMLNGTNKLIENLATLSDELSLMINEDTGSEITKSLLKSDNTSLNIFNQLDEQLQERVQGRVQEKVQEPQQAKVQVGEVDNNKETVNKNNINSILPKNELIKLETELNEIIKNSGIKTVDSTLADINNEKPITLENASIKDIFEEIKSTFKETPELVKLLTDKIAGKITYSLVNKAIFMNKYHLEGPNKVKAFYEQLHGKVVNLLNQSDGSNDDKIKHLSKEMHQIKNNIEFMNTLSQKYNYIQLPMILNDKLLNGELYVFNNKKEVKRDKGTITALLQLDFVNLGHLDIYINKEQKNLFIQFFTEDDTKNKMINEKINALHNQLSKMGFKVMSISAKKKDKDFQVMDDFLNKKEVAHEIKRYTFDMRA